MSQLALVTHSIAGRSGPAFVCALKVHGPERQCAGVPPARFVELLASRSDSHTQPLALLDVLPQQRIRSHRIRSTGAFPRATPTRGLCSLLAYESD